MRVSTRKQILDAYAVAEDRLRQELHRRLLALLAYRKTVKYAYTLEGAIWVVMEAGGLLHHDRHGNHTAGGPTFLNPLFTLAPLDATSRVLDEVTFAYRDPAGKPHLVKGHAATCHLRELCG